jgi:tRNA threonylcarbamoyladenosine biosynthesis protein TsaB
VRLLALEAATEACSVAVLCGAEVLERELGPVKSEAWHLLGMAEALLAEAGLTLGALDGIAVSIGPGAFTGVRVCVAVAQGLAFGAQLPLLPVSSLETLSLQALHGVDAGALVCMDARMGEVYWGCFGADAKRVVSARSVAAVGPPDSVRLPEPAGRWHGVGRGFAAYPQLKVLPNLTLAMAADQALPRARDMLRIAAPRLLAGEGLDAAAIEPLYLRNNVALTEAQRAEARALVPKR